MSAASLSICQYIHMFSICMCVSYRCPRMEGACVTNPCRHGGTCLDMWSWQQCQCANGLTGKYCEKSKEHDSPMGLKIDWGRLVKEVSLMEIYRMRQVKGAI